MRNSPMDGYGTGFGELGTGVGALLAQLFGGHQPNPADAAIPYLNKIPGNLSRYLSPYVGSGQNALSTLQGQYGGLINNPSSMLAGFGKNFQEDPGYQWNLKQGENAITNAAAAGGMAGSPMHQQQAGQLASNLANQQYQNYLQNVMGLYGQGMAGEQGLNQLGFQGSEDMAQGLAQALMQQANLAYAGQANQNQQQGGTAGAWGGILGGLGDILGHFFHLK